LFNFSEHLAATDHRVLFVFDCFVNNFVEAFCVFAILHQTTVSKTLFFQSSFVEEFQVGGCGPTQHG
jgi:hypothetical protein